MTSRALICPQCNGPLNRNDLSRCPHCGTEFEISEDERRRREAEESEEARRLADKHRELVSGMKKTGRALAELQATRLFGVFLPEYRRLRRVEWDLMEEARSLGLALEPAPFLLRWELPPAGGFALAALANIAGANPVAWFFVFLWATAMLYLLLRWYGRNTVPDQMTEDHDG